MRREDEGVVGGVTRDRREEIVLGYRFIVERQRIPPLICRRTHRSRVYLLFSGMCGGCLGHGQSGDAREGLRRVPRPWLVWDGKREGGSPKIEVLSLDNIRIRENANFLTAGNSAAYESKSNPSNTKLNKIYLEFSHAQQCSLGTLKTLGWAEKCQLQFFWLPSLVSL